MPTINVTPPTQEALRAAAAAAQAAQPAGPGLLDYMLYILIGVAVALLPAVLIVRRVMRARAPETNPVAQLQLSMRGRPDAIGIIIDPSTGRISFRPLRRVGGIFVYESGGAKKVYLPTLGKVYTLGGYPARIGVEYGRVAIEEDPCRLAAIALGRSLLGPRGDVYDKQLNPKRAVEELLDRLASMEARHTGRLGPVDGVAFEVSPTELGRATVSYLAELQAMLLEADRDIWAQIEETSQAVAGRTPAWASPGFGQALFWIMVGVGVIIIMAVMGWVLPNILQVGGGG